ncbi:uncharacterized protein A1O9_02354 [Exophiala aquamarina CBS 119918]|uniref:C2H2-type domain-containing protein n=1 Tax=Exophiala aquamarina CBS 119918 TaxID=1182545 RepID=A0A072PM57_9EURO|nr:uncharacterized protein A1O9_02354 [Exophiala aquamarina CBS 119918]KEF60792.1 hypothetical protein A1O9_02354 [Exophiala aquamarina CBS 119918]
MPFFASPPANKPKATGSNAYSPTSAKRSKAPNNYQSHKAETKKQQKQDYSPRESYYSDCESRPESEKTFVDIKNFLVDINQSQMAPSRSNPPPDRDRTDYGRQERERGNRQAPPRNPPRLSGDTNEFPGVDMDDVANRMETVCLGESQPFPVASIYEQILILRQHGAAVKYTTKSRGDCLRDELPQPGQSIRRGDSPVSLTDILSPSREEINAIDHALASVINTGGEVEFHPLQPRQSGALLECDACSKVFTLQQDRDQHIGGGALKCPTCGIQLPCQGLVEDHMHNRHRGRNSSGLSSADRPTFSNYQERNDHQPWAQR